MLYLHNFYYKKDKTVSLPQACMVEDNTTAILFPGEHGFNDEQATRQQVCNDIKWLCGEKNDIIALRHHLLLSMHQAEYQVEEHMYRVFMERGEDSPDYQELVQLREDAASRHQITV